MWLPKDASNNFTKTMFSLRDMIKDVFDQQTVIPIVTSIDRKSLKWSLKLTNQSIGKVWREDSLAILGYDDLKSLKK